MPYTINPFTLIDSNAFEFFRVDLYIIFLKSAVFKKNIFEELIDHSEIQQNIVRDP